MGEKLTGLQDIRKMFENNTKQCPKCGSALTIEKTDYFESEVCENCLDHSLINDMEGCCSNISLHPVKFIIEGGGIQVRKQCQSCGYIKPGAIGGFNPKDRDRLPLADLRTREQRNDIRTQQVRRFYAKVRALKDKQVEVKRAEMMTDYSQYLKSPEWQKKRDLVLKRDNYLCQSCLDAFATQVHHKSYQFVDLKGGEPAFDLEAVCTPCHERIEDMKKEGRKKIQ